MIKSEQLIQVVYENTVGQTDQKRDPINGTSQSLGQGDGSGDAEKQMGLRYVLKVIMTSVMMIAWLWKTQERG